ncbi:RNA polymerase, sigma-24 subunit, ECF subfamily [Methylocella silvestris BL2]|uniref:RNA polymerase, sigma-24 subunit, ECF subfamily n=1 Tax=Methylocella silvestris (strain DSM 15510 / CIP 108128 / LMG 27833 / NCIMB 13906 / BL2) TaxID=395965 RepID=B8EQK9_METSB|nr:sigma-70 family RNA polymerase sigma factor [Methylocella silvestris]ACK52222.1 RNA polymerase, sigma-24 subunit, ECF subfamily [Methylocella silvestris BL2]
MSTWPDAIGRLFARHRAKLEAIVVRRIRDRDAAADIVQDVFANVLASGTKGSQDADTRVLFAAARNAAIDRGLMTARRTRLLSSVLPEQIMPAPPSADAELESRQAIAALDRALEELTPRARQIFLMHRVYGASNMEIARRLGISVSAVEKQLARALRHCQNRLQDYLGPP